MYYGYDRFCIKLKFILQNQSPDITRWRIELRVQVSSYFGAIERKDIDVVMNHLHYSRSVIDKLPRLTVTFHVISSSPNKKYPAPQAITYILDNIIRKVWTEDIL